MGTVSKLYVSNNTWIYVYMKNLTKFQLQFQLQLLRVSTPIPTPTLGVSTPTPTPASLLNINSNSNSGSFNSNSNSGKSLEYQLQLQLRRFQLQFQLRSWSWSWTQLQLQLQSWPQPWILLISLLWRHNGHNSVSNHQPYDCLLRRLFRRRSKQTSKLRVTGLCVGNSPGPVNFPHKWPVTRKMFPFDDVIMWWSWWCTNTSK